VPLQNSRRNSSSAALNTRWDFCNYHPLYQKRYEIGLYLLWNTSRKSCSRSIGVGSNDFECPLKAGREGSKFSRGFPHLRINGLAQSDEIWYGNIRGTGACC